MAGHAVVHAAFQRRHQHQKCSGQRRAVHVGQMPKRPLPLLTNPVMHPFDMAALSDKRAK